MTKLLEDAYAKVRVLSPDMQDQVARLLMAYVGDKDPVIELTSEEQADLEEAQAEMARGEFATDAEVQAVFTRHRL